MEQSSRVRWALIGIAVLIVGAAVTSVPDAAGVWTSIGAAGALVVLAIAVGGSDRPDDPAVRLPGDALPDESGAASLVRDTALAEPDRGRLVIGIDAGGGIVSGDAERGIVVAGSGAMAVAVFRALTDQLCRCVRDGEELRTHLADEAPPDGVAVAALVAPGLGRVASIVLVPGLSAVPRRWDATISVTRAGCRLSHRSGPDDSGVPVDPVLPVRSTCGSSPLSTLSGDG